MDSWESSDQQKDVLMKGLVEDDKKMKEENETCKNISTWKNMNYVMIKEKVEQSPWTVKKSEEK